jgi:hypothetical protein
MTGAHCVTTGRQTPMKNYEVTFEWPNGDWTWIYVETEDFHKAMLLALASCPRDCRVHHLQFMTADQVAANKAHDGARWTSVGKHEARDGTR